MSRPDIELALDVRSYERIVVVTSPDSTFEYQESWIKPNRSSDFAQCIDGESIVVVDRVEIQRKTLSQIALHRPRLVAFAVSSIDHEKAVRRMVTALFPWSELWTVSTSFGKLLVSKDIRGNSYERGDLMDMRPEASA